MYHERNPRNIPKFIGTQQAKYFQKLCLDTRTYQADSPVNLTAPDWNSLNKLTYPPEGNHIDAFFLRQALAIKNPVVKNHFIKTANHIYSLIQNQLRSLSTQPQTLERLFGGSWIHEIDTLLLKLHRYYEHDHALNQLQLQCQRLFDQVALQLYSNFQIILSYEDFGQPRFTHIQGLMMIVEDMTQDFLTRLNHPQIQSFSELLSLPDLEQIDHLSPTHKHFIVLFKSLYANYVQLRNDFTTYMSMLDDLRSPDTTNKQIEPLGQKPIHQFMHHNLCPFMLQFLRPLSDQSPNLEDPSCADSTITNKTSEFSTQIQSKILNPPHDSTTIDK